MTSTTGILRSAAKRTWGYDCDSRGRLKHCTAWGLEYPRGPFFACWGRYDAIQMDLPARLEDPRISVHPRDRAAGGPRTDRANREPAYSPCVARCPHCCKQPLGDPGLGIRRSRTKTVSISSANSPQ